MTDHRQHPIRFLVLEASLRRGSLNTCLAALAADTLKRRGAIVERLGMREFDCPTYDGDIEQSVGAPAAADALRRRLERADAFVIASPEYNASIPGGLKNAIDWVSRTSPQPFNGKQGLLMSASPSMAGGNRGLWALRVPLEHLTVLVLPGDLLGCGDHVVPDLGQVLETPSGRNVGVLLRGVHAGHQR